MNSGDNEEAVEVLAQEDVPGQENVGVVAVAKRKRRTKAEIEQANAVAAAAKAAKLEEALKEGPMVTLKDGESFPGFSGVRPPWLLDESKALIDCMHEWHTEQENSVQKLSESQTNIWLIIIPTKMAKQYGKIRPTPDNKLSIAFQNASFLGLRRHQRSPRSTFFGGASDWRQREKADRLALN
jgi:hypothetical protein